MRDYFIKRLLLILPTLFGITIACFVVMQMVPGVRLNKRFNGSKVLPKVELPVEAVFKLPLQRRKSIISKNTMVLTNQYWFAISVAGKVTPF